MKMVQTCWTGNKTNLFKFNAGWFSAEYNLMGWALSCLQLRKYYNDVQLHADTSAAKMLIDTLRLPYTEVVCDLDQFNNYNSNLYSLPKVHTYAQQSAPFLHVDGDVFIFKAFDEGLLNSDLIAQNLEVGTKLYEDAFIDLEKALAYSPAEITRQKQISEKIYAYNAGILGGRDLCFFEHYGNRAFKIISENHGLLSGRQIKAFNIYFEQCLFYCLASEQQKKVDVLFNDLIPDNGYTPLGGFVDVPYNKQYIHLVGLLKNRKGVCVEVAERLRREYPEYYYRIITLFKNQNAPLKTDYYYYLNEINEHQLVNRYHKLRNDFLNNAELLKYSPACPSQIVEKHNIKLIENVQTYLSSKSVKKFTDLEQNSLITDAELFEKEITVILNKKINTHSKEVLYVRDLFQGQNIEYVFTDEKTINKKKLVKDGLIEIISSRFDWSAFIRENDAARLLNPDFSDNAPQIYLAVVPECLEKGYTVVSCDDLDFQLLKVLERPVSIEKAIDNLIEIFDLSDMQASLDDLKTLIIGRIKLGLQSKLIKVCVE